MSTLLERYRAGEHRQVWAELLVYSDAVRDEPLFSDAMAVARETMGRVRANIEQLIPRLEAVGYQFWYSPSQRSNKATLLTAPPVFLPPPDDALEQIRELERIVGVIPLSLRAFYEAIGTVNFVGIHPDWHLDYELDPLYVNPLPTVVGGYQYWQELRGVEERLDIINDEEDSTLFPLPIAPDEYIKYNVSGGMWYNLRVPNPNADASLNAEWHRTTFVDYLRICLQWGGLPGLERVPDPPRKELTFLTQGLLPI